MFNAGAVIDHGEISLLCFSFVSHSDQTKNGNKTKCHLKGSITMYFASRTFLKIHKNQDIFTLVIIWNIFRDNT